jgi:hypothetical protein
MAVSSDPIVSNPAPYRKNRHGGIRRGRSDRPGVWRALFRHMRCFLVPGSVAPGAVRFLVVTRSLAPSSGRHSSRTVHGTVAALECYTALDVSCGGGRRDSDRGGLVGTARSTSDRPAELDHRIEHARTIVALPSEAVTTR